MIKRLAVFVIVGSFVSVVVSGCGVGTKGPRKYEKNPDESAGNGVSGADEGDGPALSGKIPTGGSGKSDRAGSTRLEARPAGNFAPLETPYTGTLALGFPENGNISFEAYNLNFRIPGDMPAELAISKSEEAGSQTPDFGFVILSGTEQTLNTKLYDYLEDIGRQSQLLLPLIKSMSLQPGKDEVSFEVSVYDVVQRKMVSTTVRMSLEKAGMTSDSLLSVFPFPEHADLIRLARNSDPKTQFKYRITGKNLVKGGQSGLISMSGNSRVDAAGSDGAGNLYIVGRAPAENGEAGADNIQGFVGKVGPEFGQKWRRELPAVGSTETDMDVAVDGDVVYVAGQRRPDSASGENAQMPFIAKYSGSSGDKRWDKALAKISKNGHQVGSDASFDDFTVLEDGTILLHAMSDGPETWMIKISPQGRVLKIAQSPIRGVKLHLAAAPNGGFVFAGNLASQDAIRIAKSKTLDRQSNDWGVYHQYASDAEITDLEVDPATNSVLAVGMTPETIDKIDTKPRKPGQHGFVLKQALATGETELAKYIAPRKQLFDLDIVPSGQTPGAFFVSGTEASEPGLPLSRIDSSHFDGMWASFTHNSGEFNRGPMWLFGTSAPDIPTVLISAKDFVYTFGFSGQRGAHSGFMFRTNEDGVFE